MSVKTVTFKCIGSPDDAAMKAQLGAIYGVVEMNIDSKSHNVAVLYDDARVSDSRIASCLDTLSYQMQR